FFPHEQLTILPSPFRDLVGPVRQYVEQLRTAHPDAYIHVVVSQILMDHYLEQALHQNATVIFKLALQHIRQDVVTDVAYTLHLSEAARERARKRLLTAAKKYGILPIGFITGQLQSERRHATAGRLVIELGRNGAPGDLEQRLRGVLRDPTLTVLYWSNAAGAYLDGGGKPVPLPAKKDKRVVTYLERDGRPMTALVHDPAALDDPDLTETVLAAVRFV